MRLLILNLLCFNCLVLFGQTQDKELNFIQSFMNNMKKGNDVRTFISSKYMFDNGLSTVDWQCDYLLVKKYLLIKEDVGNYLIKVDHGSGKYCTVIRVKVITENGQLMILPSNYIFSKTINKYIVVPWFDKNKIC